MWRCPILNCVLEGGCFAYREWAKCGDQLTKTLDHQLERWEKFVGRWSKEKGSKKMVMGDLNFDYWKTTASQKCLRPIRDLVLENIASSGWYQLINEPTRYQNGSISCLDHLYSRSVVDIVEIKNENETGYDHNCIGQSLTYQTSFRILKSLTSETLKV